MFNATQFWAGRSPSLADQALGPIQNPIEMANTLETVISDAVRRGDELFRAKAGCAQCHVGTNFSDAAFDLYHNTGVGMEADEPDPGRFAVSQEEEDRGAFKTPTLRNVTETAPYMHDGSQATLDEVLEFYVGGGEANPWLDPKMKPLELIRTGMHPLVRR